MQARSIRPTSQGYLTIFESELRMACGLSAQEPHRETGGDMYGLWGRDHDPVCLLCTGPGRNATHEVTRFRQDLEFWKRAQEIMTACGLQVQGSWHSHHSLGIDETSSGDRAQVRSLACQNTIERWGETILTHEHRSTWRPRGRREFEPGIENSLSVKVNAFIYTDPKNGRAARASIKVIPGISPYRLWLLATGRLEPREIGEHAVSFPMDQIIYDPVELPQDRTNEVPEAIVAQIRELPEAGQENLKVRPEPGRIVVILDAPGGATTEVAFADQPPYAILAVAVKGESGEHELVDVTDRFVGHGLDARLRDVYEALAAVRSNSIGSMARARRQILSFLRAL